MIWETAYNILTREKSSLYKQYDHNYVKMYIIDQTTILKGWQPAVHCELRSLPDTSQRFPLPSHRLSVLDTVWLFLFSWRLFSFQT